MHEKVPSHLLLQFDSDSVDLPRGHVLSTSNANIAQGCRIGASCPFFHDASVPYTKVPSTERQQPTRPTADDTSKSAQSMLDDTQNLRIGDSSPTKQSAADGSVQPQRPVSKIEQSDPREFQINQLRRRYRPYESNDENGSTLSFGLAPSDPDFPFELEKLQCVLHVPNSYPRGRPSLKVTNSEMEAAYQANVARGFDDIVDFTYRTNGRGTLLGWLNNLDRKLESLLTTLERGTTFKFFANVGDGKTARDPPKALETDTQSSAPQATASAKIPAAPPRTSQPRDVPPKHTFEAKAAAEKRRAQEIKQLEARLGRLPMFQRLSDGRTFVIPVQPMKKDCLPRALQALKTVKLVVPQLYPLESSSIKLQGVEGDEAKATELGFIQWVEQTSQISLVSQINYLASNIHKLAQTPLLGQNHVDTPAPAVEADEKDAEVEQTSPEVLSHDDEDKPHIHVIPRPPEWSVPGTHSEDDESEGSSYDEDEFSDEEEEGGAPVPAAVDNNSSGRGVALSFPYLELYGIELLELTCLNITVKCERCKVPVDIKNVPQITDEKGQMAKQESCLKCANNMSFGM